MDNHIKRFIVCSLLLGLTACQGIRITSNLTPDNVGDALQTYKVEVYSVEEIYNYDSQMVGDVRSSFCQVLLGGPRPTRSMILGDLKYKVQQLGGNCIVVMECSTPDPYGECRQYIECRALAFEVDFS